jgi:hypothetical protein
MRYWVGALAAGMLVGAVQAAGQSTPASAPAESTAIDWRAAALQDVKAAYDIYVMNHPGVEEPANKNFVAQLQRARDAGLARAAKARDRFDYMDALGAFTAELSDGHAQAFANPLPAAPSAQREWPGFVVAWRGKGAFVHRAGEGAPAPVGSRILACNGQSITDFLKTRQGLRAVRPAEAGGWWFWTPRAFVSSPSLPLRTRAQSCRFSTPSGETVDAKLSWLPAPAELADWQNQASDGDRTPIGLTEPRPGMFLIGLPDFQPNEQAVASYRALYEALRTRRSELLKARAVVLDLRHNNGGSSTWPQQTAHALWGRTLVERRLAKYNRDVRVWWRATPDNIAHVVALEGRLLKEGNKEDAAWIKSVATGMKKARTAGQPFYVEEEDEAPATGGPTVSQLKVPIYVITPGRCGSACLDAVDIFKRFDNVKLIGAPTSADSPYMDVRVADLPSGHGRIVVPNKVYSGRRRRGGEIYVPDIEVRDIDWSTAVFLDRIERDLGGRR